MPPIIFDETASIQSALFQIMQDFSYCFDQDGWFVSLMSQYRYSIRYYRSSMRGLVYRMRLWDSCKGK